MASGDAGSIRRQIDAIFRGGSAAGLSDAQLLERFARRRGAVDDLAFEALLTRHGPMVLAVCRRMLGDGHDAEDAFQATFLVLVRKARSIWVRDSLAGWLHAVAIRVSARSRAQAARRRKKEQPGIDRAEAPACPDPDATELRPMLDEELGQLPESYRAPLILCYLEGMTHEQAAARLGCPVGTVRSRLARGRDRLRGRLARRGLDVAVGPLVAVLKPGAASATLPEALMELTIRAARALAAGRSAAAGVVPAASLALMEGVLNAMWITRLMLVTTGILTVSLIATGTAVGLARQAPRGEPAAPSTTSSPRLPDQSATPAPITRSNAPRSSATPVADPSSPGVSPHLLEARLQIAQEHLKIIEARHRTGATTFETFNQARGQVTLIKAEIQGQSDDLQDELELLEAQRKTRQAELATTVVEVQRAERILSRFRKLAEARSIEQELVIENEDKLNVRKAELRIKEAEVNEIEVRIRQVQRRLDRLNRLIPPADRPGSKPGSEAPRPEGVDAPPPPAAPSAPNPPKSESPNP